MLPLWILLKVQFEKDQVLETQEPLPGAGELKYGPRNQSRLDTYLAVVIPLGKQSGSMKRPLLVASSKAIQVLLLFS